MWHRERWWQSLARVLQPLHAAAITVGMLAVPLVALTLAIPATAEAPPAVDKVYESLKTLIAETPLEQITQDWLINRVYRAHPDRQVRLKKILGGKDPMLQAKSAKMARIRMAIGIEFLGQVARNKGWAMEVTNQGKTIGHASDWDITAWISGGLAEGRRGHFEDVVAMWHEHLGRLGIVEGMPDVTMFNGDEFLPDWSNSRMGTQEFIREMAGNIVKLRQNKEAYYVPGANKEQTHNRALAEGRTFHVAWDHVRNALLVNNVVFDVNQFIAGKLEIEPLKTRDVAVRYHGVNAAAPERNALGNGVQNLDNFMTHAHDPYARQKYVNRIINQAFSRILAVCQQSAMGDHQTYAGVHAALADDAAKLEFKRAFVQQLFGKDLAAEKVSEIIKIFDTSVTIEQDKGQVSYEEGSQTYYKPWKDQARSELQAESSGRPVAEAEVLARAEQIFVQKQLALLGDGVVEVLKHAMTMDMTEEGRRGRLTIGGAGEYGETEAAQRENVQKLMAERAIEMAFLFETVHKIPDPKLRERVLNNLLNSAPNAKLKAVLVKMNRLAIAGRDVLNDWLGEVARQGKMVDPDAFMRKKQQMMEQATGAKVTALGGEANAAVVNDRMAQRLGSQLGPAATRAYLEAVRIGRETLAAAPGAAASYLKRAYDEAGYLALMGTATNLLRTYEQQCLGARLETGVCGEVLGQALVSEIPWYLPGVNLLMMTASGAEAAAAGEVHGLILLPVGALGLAELGARAAGANVALPLPGIHLYFAYRLVEGAYGATYGYVIDTMNADIVEQALKSVPSASGAPMRCEQQALATTLPDFPILSDRLKPPVEAENWSAERRMTEARTLFGVSIDYELLARGFSPQAGQWKTERERLLRLRMCQLPYFQRMSMLYGAFHEEIDRVIFSAAERGDDTLTDEALPVLEVCMERIEDDRRNARAAAEAEGSEALDEHVSALANEPSAFAQCLPRAVERTSGAVRVFFMKEALAWLGKQREAYQGEYDTTSELIAENVPFLRQVGELAESVGVDTTRTRSRLLNQIVDILVREYVVGQYLAEQRDKVEAEFARKLEGMLADSSRVRRLATALVESQGQAGDEFAEAYAEETLRNLAREISLVEPKLQLVLPGYAGRLGRDAMPVEVNVIGEYGRGTLEDPTNVWRVDVDRDVKAEVKDGAPADLIMTQELHDEMMAEESKDKKLYTVEETVVARLLDGNGRVLAEASGIVNWYDLLIDPATLREEEEPEQPEQVEEQPQPTPDLDGILAQMRAAEAEARAAGQAAQAACNEAQRLTGEAIAQVSQVEGALLAATAEVETWEQALAQLNAASAQAEQFAWDAQQAATEARRGQTTADQIASAACNRLAEMQASRSTEERRAILADIAAAVRTCQSIASTVRQHAQNAAGAASACAALEAALPSLMPPGPPPVEASRQMEAMSRDLRGQVDMIRAIVEAARGRIQVIAGAEGRAVDLAGSARTLVAGIDLTPELGSKLSEMDAIVSAIQAIRAAVENCPDEVTAGMADLEARQANLAAAAEDLAARANQVSSTAESGMDQAQIADALQRTRNFAEMAGWSADGMEEILIAVASCQAMAERLANERIEDLERQRAEDYCGSIPGMMVVPNPYGPGYACQCADPNTEFSELEGRCVPRSYVQPGPGIPPTQPPVSGQPPPSTSPGGGGCGGDGSSITLLCQEAPPSN